MKQAIAILVAGLLGTTTSAPGQVGGDYDLTWNTIDGGGVSSAAGGDFELAGTIGQPDASPVSIGGGDYELIGGFWHSACPFHVPPDFDWDCDVDEADFMTFAGCAQGAGVGYDPLPTGCTLPLIGGYMAADFDADDDVDVEDFAVLQRCYSENGPADASCAD